MPEQLIPQTKKPISARIMTDGSTFQATLEKPATENDSGKRYRIDLDDRETASVRAVADAFGLSLAAFLRIYLFEQLPGQFQRSAQREAAAAAAPARFECSDPVTKWRIERAASLNGQTVERFIMELIAHDLEGQEADCWIVHPNTTDALICKPWLDSMLARGCEYLAPLEAAALRTTVTAPCVAAGA